MLWNLPPKRMWAGAVKSSRKREQTSLLGDKGAESQWHHQLRMASLFFTVIEAVTILGLDWADGKGSCIAVWIEQEPGLPSSLWGDSCCSRNQRWVQSARFAFSPPAKGLTSAPCTKNALRGESCQHKLHLFILLSFFSSECLLSPSAPLPHHHIFLLVWIVWLAISIPGESAGQWFTWLEPAGKRSPSQAGQEGWLVWAASPSANRKIKSYFWRRILLAWRPARIPRSSRCQTRLPYSIRESVLNWIRCCIHTTHPPACAHLERPLGSDGHGVSPGSASLRIVASRDRRQELMESSQTRSSPLADNSKKGKDTLFNLLVHEEPVPVPV